MAEEEGSLGPWEPGRTAWKAPNPAETPQQRAARGENITGGGLEGENWTEIRKALEILHPATKNAILNRIRRLCCTDDAELDAEMRVEALSKAYQNLGNTP